MIQCDQKRDWLKIFSTRLSKSDDFIMGEELDYLFVIIPIVACTILYFLFCTGSSNNRKEEKKNENQNPISQKPIVTIASNFILANENNEIDNNTRAALEILAKRATIFVFPVVKDQAEADIVKPKLAEELKDLVEERNILPCQTAIGRASMARQLCPVAHFDYEPEAVLQTSIFMPTVLIAPKTVVSPKAKWSSESFADFMTSGNTEFFALLN